MDEATLPESTRFVDAFVFDLNGIARGKRLPAADWPAGPPATFFMDRLATAFQAELSAFIDVVAGHRISPCTVDDAIAVAYMAEAASLSLKEHRPVRIDEVRLS